MNKRHTLLLWDIDGTLVLYKEKFPHHLFAKMIEVFFYKKTSLAEYRFSGKTDKAIIGEVLKIAGVSEADHLAKEEAIMEWIADTVAEETTPNSFDLLPNVNELLSSLSA